MTKLSAAIITLNEEENIERCLRSLAGWIDDVVVIDSNSRDRTRELAEAMGTRVVVHDWEGFVGQKNFALAQCRHDWAFSIDADEEVSPELRREIEALLPGLDERGARDNVWAYAVPRRVFYNGRWIMHGDWYPDYVTRLVYRPKAHFEGGAVHERLEHEGRYLKLKSPLFHYTYKDEADHRQRIEKYSALWARGKYDSGARASALSPYLRSAFRFFRAIVLKRGLLDGPTGWRVATLCSREVYLKYRKLRELTVQNR